MGSPSCLLDSLHGCSPPRTGLVSYLSNRIIDTKTGFICNLLMHAVHI